MYVRDSDPFIMKRVEKYATKYPRSKYFFFFGKIKEGRAFVFLVLVRSSIFGARLQCDFRMTPGALTRGRCLLLECRASGPCQRTGVLSQPSRNTGHDSVGK